MVRRSTRASRPVKRAQETHDVGEGHLIKEKETQEGMSVDGEDSHKEDQEIEDPSSSSEEESEAEVDQPDPRTRRSTRMSASKDRKIEETQSNKRKVRFMESTKPPVERRTTKANLKAFAKRVLEPGETPETSLVAALLNVKGNDDAGRIRKKSDSSYHQDLKKICTRVLEHYDSDSSEAEVDLLNLIFRSVGGTVETLFPSLDLDNISDDQWEDAILSVVGGMEVTPMSKVLFCADPEHTQGGSSKANASTRAYRQIYRDFWKTLAALALTRDNSKSKSSGKNSMVASRFDVETARGVVLRITEATATGQPDIRSAATVALYELSMALLEATVILKSKIAETSRQLQATSQNDSNRKAQALSSQLQYYQRTLSDVEQIVHDHSCTAVFMNRYRDANEHIRAESLNYLAAFISTRPDIFLIGTYLRYFGWLLNDKSAAVRKAAIAGLLVAVRSSQAVSGSIEAGLMTSVVDAFLGRISQMVLDVDRDVQEGAMALLLVLLRGGFLDEVNDDDMWQKLNSRALAINTTPTARRDALYFVFEQLQPFDDSELTTESKAVDRIDGLCKWISHMLLLRDEKISIEKLRFDLVDLVVESLRSMDDHKGLTTNWSAMIRAFTCGDSTKIRLDSDRKNAAVKERVLARFFLCSAAVHARESSYADTLLGTSDDDEDDVASGLCLGPPLKKTKKSIQSEQEDERLTFALLRSLPKLLVAYRGDAMIIRSLTTLTKYMNPSALGLAHVKKDVLALLGGLRELFLVSPDPAVLANIAFVLSVLANQGFTRSGEALLQLKKTAVYVRHRILSLLQSKVDGEYGGDDENMPSRLELQNSIWLALLRLRVLSKRLDVVALFDSPSDPDLLANSIVADLARELQARKIPESQEGATLVAIPDIWSEFDPAIHGVVAKVVGEALQFLLMMEAWKVLKVCAAPDEYENEEAGAGVEEIKVMSGRISRLLGICFSQHSFVSDQVANLPPEAASFVHEVESHASRIAGDLRALLPRRWANAESPVVRECAFLDDSMLAAGSVRFVREDLTKLRETEGGGEKDASNVLLAPARGLVAGWEYGNRREAGRVLSHIVGSGEQARTIVSNLSLVLKKLEPVRLIEAHMAGLQQEFGDWLEDAPEEPESVRPTEKQIFRYEQADKAHSARFEFLTERATRLSASLGTGKASNAGIFNTLVSFLQEGMRYSFGAPAGSNDHDAITPRLPFLQLLPPYVALVRSDRGTLKMLQKDYEARERALRRHPEFGLLNETEFDSLAVFRKALGLSAFQELQREPPAADEASGSSSTGSGGSQDSPVTSSAVPGVSGVEVASLSDQKDVEEEDSIPDRRSYVAASTADDSSTDVEVF